ARTLDEVEQPHLGRGDDIAELRVRERAVADEVDRLHLRRRTLVDLEHEVYAIVLKLDDLGIDRRGKPSLAAIKIENALNVGLDTRPGVDRALLELHLALERRLVDLVVALERDNVDDRIFDDGHNRGSTLTLDTNVGEQASCEQ